MKTITVFTPTYNRKHTIHRTFESLCRQTCDDFEWLIIDDGSSDGTREWVESLGEKLSGELSELRKLNELSEAKMLCVDWMGRFFDRNVYDGVDHGDCVELNSRNYFQIIVHPTPSTHSTSPQLPPPSPLTITYIYKPNGGLYTGYNVAYQTILTELCVCIDSDDYMPDDAIEKILTLWKKHYPNGTLNAKRLTQNSQSSNLSTLTNIEYCGITGLDFNVEDKKAIGGYFPDGLQEVFFNELRLKGLHSGDTKQVLRTDLMKTVAPMIGFDGEKNFNPIYMMIQVMDKYPVLLMNENLCWVEYQIGADSMSQGIFKQYVNSPRSFAKMRLMEMALKHNTFKDRFRSAFHYVSSCIIAKDKNWLKSSPKKLLTILVLPLGFIWYLYILFKTRK